MSKSNERKCFVLSLYMTSTLVEFLKKEKKFQTQNCGHVLQGQKKKKKKRWENANEKIVEKEISNLQPGMKLLQQLLT